MHTNAGSAKSRFRLWAFAAVAAVALVAKLPFAVGPFRLYSDAMAYVNIAHNWAAGHGFVSTLRLNYFDSGPVTHFALADWPPFYPFFAGVMMRLGVGDAGLQIVNAVLAALAAGLVFLLADRLFGRATALVAGIVAALALNLFRSALNAVSDPLGLTLALAALLAATGAEGRRNRWLVAGGLAGLAYLTRFPNVILMIAFLGYALVRRDRHAVWCIAGFVLTAGPILVWKWVVYGSPFFGVQAMHYSTSSFRESSWQWRPAGSGPSKDLIGPAPLADISAAILRNVLYFAASLSVLREGLNGLLFGLAAAFLAFGRTFVTRERGLVLAVAAGNLAVYSLTWSLPAAQGTRFMLLSYCLMLPFAAAGIVWLFQRRPVAIRVLAVAVVVMTIVSYCFDYAPSAQRAPQFQPLSAEVVRGVVRLLPAGTTVASNNPWLISYQTGLPTTALPRNLDRYTLPAFMRTYKIRALVVLDSRLESATLRTLRDHAQWFVIRDLGKLSVAIPSSQFPIDQGQNAYDGTCMPIPQIVQMLPTMHSPSITPRKNGSAWR